MMATEFWIELKGQKYDENTGWYCSALNLPSAQVTRIVVRGEEKSLLDFTLGAASIRFSGPGRGAVADGAALIKINRKLVTVDTAVIVALISMVGTLGASWLARGNRPVPSVPLVDNGRVQTEAPRPPVPPVASDTRPSPIQASPQEPRRSIVPIVLTLTNPFPYSFDLFIKCGHDPPVTKRVFRGTAPVPIEIPSTNCTCQKVAPLDGGKTPDEFPCPEFTPVSRSSLRTTLISTH